MNLWRSSKKIFSNENLGQTIKRNNKKIDNEEKNLKSTFISGSIVIGMTILIYILGCINIITLPIVWISFIFVMLSEVFSLFILLKIKKDLLRVSIGSVSALYLVSTILLAFIFINIWPSGLQIYTIINILIIGLTWVSIVMLNNFVDYVVEENKETLSAEATMLECQSIVESYMNNPEYLQYKKQLYKIYEDIKYSDISSECGIEGILLQKIEEIDNEKENLLDFLKEVSYLVKERNIKMKALKKGII